VRTLRLRTYLAPSLPAALFEWLAGEIAAGVGIPAAVEYETAVSGPTPEDDPFREGRADLAFVCAPSYPMLAAAGSPVVLLPAAPVFTEPRAQGRPVYFSDVVVRRGHPAARFEELAGSTWCYNDRRSRSGWQNMLARLSEIGHGSRPETFFRELIHSGSHLGSLGLVADGRADAAAIDSNTLWLAAREDPERIAGLRVLESWGPMPIQPVLAHAGIEAATRDRIRDVLLSLHEGAARRERLGSFGVARFSEVDEASYAAVHPLEVFRTAGGRRPNA